MSINQRLYNQIMMADDFTCVYCGKRTPDVGVDHYVPRAHGGPDTISNLMACCPSCNSRKSDRCAHEAKMYPRYGRFKAYNRRHPDAKPAIVRAEQAAAEIVPHADRVRIAQELAEQRKPTGEWAYSANRIVARVGGQRDLILAAIREARRG